MADAGVALTAAAADAPSSSEVLAQLDRILSHPEFSRSARGREFLRYIVEETVAGRADRIKAYSVALAVFGRGESFDAQTDPLVRIEAGRLRRAVERYYLLAGRSDPCIISIPKGGYVPHFERNALHAADATVPATPPAKGPVARPAPRRWLAWLGAGVAVLAAALGGLALWQGLPTLSRRESPEPAIPTLVVMPFVNLGDMPEAKVYADGLSEEVVSQLARFRELTVLGRETSRSLPPGADLARIRRELGVGYVLEGSVQAAMSQLRVTGRLLDAQSGAVLWSHTYDNDLRVRDLVTIQDDVAQKVATAVAQPYGIIFRANEKRAGSNPPDDLEAYACTLRFYGYRSAPSVESHAAIRTCLERAVATYSSYATAWAMLSILYLDEDRFAFNSRPGPPGAIQRSIEAARRAIRLDPENVRALQALMMALFFSQRPAEALEIGERAVALNPNDTELLAEFGIRLGQVGAWERGTALLEQALARNPGHTDFYNGALAIHAYMQRDYRRAGALIGQVNLEKFPLYHFIAAIIYAQLDMKPETAEARSRFLQMRPRFFENWDQEAAKRNYRPEDAIHLADGARKAGFPVPDRTAAEAAPPADPPER